MQGRTSIIIGLIIIGIAGGVVWLLSGGPHTTGQPVNQKVQVSTPNADIQYDNKSVSFTLADYDGNPVRSSDYRGKVIIAMFWAAWCPTCKKELTDLGTLQKEFPDDVAVIAINRAEPISEARPYSDALDLQGSVMFAVDPDDAFFKTVGGYAMPETLFIGKNGDIVSHERDVLSLDKLREELHSILGN